MPTSPLPGVRNPLDTFADYGIFLPGEGNYLMLLLLAVFVVWLVYTLVVIYHWLRYSHGSLVALPAIFVHLVVSVALMSFAITASIIPTLV